MALLKELKQKRIDILKKISENQDLCKLLYYTEANPLSHPDVVDPFKTLFMKRIFPMQFMPTVSNETGAFLLCYFGEIRGNGITFKDTQIKFAVLCHKESWIMDNFQLRPDVICEELEELFNSASGFGIGKIMFERRMNIQTEKLAGYELTYKVTDFN